MAALGGLVVALRHRLVVGSAQEHANRIAVLPLENLGHDPSNDYFADGLTDEIIRNLSVIEGLTVRSRPLPSHSKISPATRTGGKATPGDYIVEGSVLRDGKLCASMPNWFGRATTSRSGPQV